MGERMKDMEKKQAAPGALVAVWWPGQGRGCELRRVEAVEEHLNAFGEETCTYTGPQLYEFGHDPECDFAGVDRLTGAFPGCWNLVYAVDEGTAARLVEEDRERLAADEAEALKGRAEELQAIVDKFDAQACKPETRAEAGEAMRAYNDLYNEGGEGYVPRIFSREERDEACEGLAAARAAMPARKDLNNGRGEDYVPRTFSRRDLLDY